MPGKDRVIDPVTQDYVSDGKGGYVYTTTLATAMQHQLLDELDGWPGDPTAGSNLHLAQKGNVDRATMIATRNAARVALQGFVDAGAARNLRTEVKPEGTRLFLETQLTDVQTGELDVSFITALEK